MKSKDDSDARTAVTICMTKKQRHMLKMQAALEGVAVSSLVVRWIMENCQDGLNVIESSPKKRARRQD